MRSVCVTMCECVEECLWNRKEESISFSFPFPPPKGWSRVGAEGFLTLTPPAGCFSPLPSLSDQV